MNRQQLKILIASNLYFQESGKEIRIMTKEDGFAVLFDTESLKGKGENFSCNANGLATAIIKLKQKEKE